MSAMCDMAISCGVLLWNEVEDDNVEDDHVDKEEDDDVEGDNVEEEDEKDENVAEDEGEDDDVAKDEVGDDDVEEGDRCQDLGPHFVRACAVETHVKISQEPLYTEIYRKNAAAQIEPRT